jgi:hypothetical protein
MLGRPGRFLSAEWSENYAFWTNRAEHPCRAFVEWRALKVRLFRTLTVLNIIVVVQRLAAWFKSGKHDRGETCGHLKVAHLVE